MAQDREQIIDEIDTKIKYAKFTNTDAVILSTKAAQFCLEHAQYYEQKIKELTEEVEQRIEDYQESQRKWEKAYDKLEYTLEGVMHSVDKWLEGSELELDEVNRAIMMREKTLKIVENLIEQNEQLTSAVNFTADVTRVETVSKMQERLKGKAKAHYFDNCNYAVSVEDIDQTAKELMEGEK